VNIDYMQLKFLHPKLRKLLKWAEAMLGFELTGTSIYRMNNETSVHGVIPVRGWDVRMRNERVGRLIAKIINENWIYDPDRPSKKCAKAHGKGFKFHIHFQVHDNTVRR
jgi:hypothetical protein